MTGASTGPTTIADRAAAGRGSRGGGFGWLPALAVALAMAAPAGAAPAARLISTQWQDFSPGGSCPADHALWDELLDAYRVTAADGAGRFDYAAVGAADRAKLAAYIESLASVAITRCDRPDQLAFWINLYNALTVSVVLDHYPVDSIRDIDISPGLFADGPWGAALVTVEGQALSLDDIEHGIVRPIWRDARVHYAFNCASIGCPDLAARAYRGAAIDAMLDAQSRRYVNHPRAVTLDHQGLTLSTIYDWYADDFGADQAALVAHIAVFAEPDLAAALARAPEIVAYSYDWRLNAPETRAAVNAR